MEILDKMETLPDPQNVSPMQTGVKYGIILALVGLVIQLIMYVMGWGDGSGGGDPTMTFLLSTISFALTIAIMIMAVRYHRDMELGGFISFGRAMGVYLWMGIVYGIITAIWGWLYANVVAPETQEVAQKTIDQVRAQVEDGEAPQMALTVVETTFAMVNNPLAMMLMGLLSTLFLGLFMSLFLKRERPLV